MYIKEITELQTTLLQWQNDVDIKAILLFCCDQNKPSRSTLEATLKLNQKPLMGGIFPEIIADGHRKQEGFLMLPLHETWEVELFESTSSDVPITTQIESWLEKSTISIESVFCFVNALWNQKTNLMQVLYDQLGPFVNYLGGGAGSLSFNSFPCVFANQQIAEHAAVVAVSKKQLSIGVAHGWRPISDPIKVTKTEGNTIISLNWKPAFSVYKEQVEAHSNLKFNAQNFFEIAKSYPLGLVRLDDEMIIRDPYATENNKLHVVDEVPEGEYIHIMHGNKDSLLEGAKNAVLQSQNNTNEETTQFCIDCISRVLFMKDDFKEELAYLNKNQKANGILSIGEIANPVNAPLELFNKTVVVAQWKKKN